MLVTDRGDTLNVTERTRLRRTYERGKFDRATIYAILDAMPLAHVGYNMDDAPVVMPTFQWREGDWVYWHGSSASRGIKAARGMSVCLTVTCLDGFVLARSALHHSANFRSVLIFGEAKQVTDPEAKSAKLRQFVETLFPGRSDILRPNTAQEEKATAILGMPIDEASAKIRTGGPVDDEEDYALPIWAGEVPVSISVGAPVADPRNLPGLEPPTHVKEVKLG